ncbi:MAG: hypothetical protein QOG43_1836 [Actinomycetota bacterium]|nr:hypothetical protein [Actinomycetota bacterium]
MAIAAGLVVLGLTAYGFLVVAARALGPEAYAPLSALWAVVFLVGPGCFIPIEQELARSLAARHAAGLGGGPVIRRAARLGGGAVVVLTVACAIAGFVLLDRLFDGEVLLVVGLLLSLVGYYAEHLARGVLAGYGRFRPYGIALATEGTLRLVGCAVLAVLGVATAGPYGVVLGAAPLIATAVALRGQHDLAPPGPEADRRELTLALGWLLAGSVLAQALANAGPVAVKLLADDSERAVAGRFLAALIVARVPLFLFTAVLAPALPRLARMAAAGDRRGFDAGLRRLLGLVAALSAAGTLGALVAGPTVVRTLFGADFELPAHDLATLALACAAYLFAMTLAQALIAVAGYGRVAMAWLAGVVSFGVVTALGSDLLTRVELGMVAGGVVSAVTMGGLLFPLLHHRVGPVPSAAELLTSPPPGMTP